MIQHHMMQNMFLHLGSKHLNSNFENYNHFLLMIHLYLNIFGYYKLNMLDDFLFRHRKMLYIMFHLHNILLSSSFEYYILELIQLLLRHMNLFLFEFRLHKLHCMLPNHYIRLVHLMHFPYNRLEKYFQHGLLL